MTNSVNVADLTGFELNRTWLWKPLHHGGRLQPLVGFRYAKFIDFYQRQTYDRYDDDGFRDSSRRNSASDRADRPRPKQLTSLDAGVINDMVGGQLGMHWDKDYRQWNFSGDVKAFALQNFQNWDNAAATPKRRSTGAMPQADTTPDTVLDDRETVTPGTPRSSSSGWKCGPTPPIE